MSKRRRQHLQMQKRETRFQMQKRESRFQFAPWVQPVSEMALQLYQQGHPAMEAAYHALKERGPSDYDPQTNFKDFELTAFQARVTVMTALKQQSGLARPLSESELTRLIQQATAIVEREIDQWADTSGR